MARPHYPRGKGEELMTTLNARANQAWIEARDPDTGFSPFAHQRHAFEEGWETGYKAAIRDIRAAIEDEQAADLSGNNSWHDGMGTADYLAAKLGGVTTDE